MAKNAKKITSLGIRPEDFQETRIPVGEAITHTHTHEQVHEHNHNHEHVHDDMHERKHVHEHTQAHGETPISEYVHEHTYTHVHEPVARIKKERRVQWLTYDSLVQRIDAYAKERGVSRADVLEAGMEKFLSDLGK